jgi:hypothetical protein
VHPSSGGAAPPFAPPSARPREAGAHAAMGVLVLKKVEALGLQEGTINRPVTADEGGKAGVYIPRW